MLIFGVDTACACAKAALWEDGKILGEARADDQRTHSVKLMPMIDRLFSEAGKKPGELDLIGAVTGPGSFTGLRIGVATAKALAYCAGIPVVGIRTTDFLAASVQEQAGRIICPAIDARNTNVYCNAYIEGEAVWECRVRASSELAEELAALAEKTGRSVVMTGDGAARNFTIYQGLLGERCCLACDREIAGRAGVLCRMAYEKRKEAVDCFALSVEYYRKTQAERLKDERKN